MKKDIYIIKNDINKKVYIGQAVNTQNRWWYHLSDARKSKKYSIIDKAINKYGKEHFHYEIITNDIILHCYQVLINIPISTNSQTFYDLAEDIYSVSLLLPNFANTTT